VLYGQKLADPALRRIRLNIVRWLVTDMMPTVLYKYLAPPHAQEMTANGVVRVGRLFEFRKVEEDPERNDGAEGRLVLHSDAGRRVYNSTAELPPVLRGMSIACGPGGIMTQGENAVVFNFDGPNMLIYCVSEAFNGSALSEWCGACVRIADPVAFFRGLDLALRAVARERGWQLGPLQVGRCAYIDRRHNWHGEVPPYWLLKPPTYNHQQEVRAGWVVAGAPTLEAVLEHF
jgi:hypothetical protein